MRRAFSDASAKAIAAAEQHPEVVERVGKPLEPVEMHTLARPDELNSDGEAFSWDVKGPKGKGVLRAIAVREEGVWRPTQIRFTFEDDSSVDISSPDAK